MKSHCEEVRDHMHELVFDELAPELRARVVDHVTQCPECALEHARWSLDLGAIGPAWEVEPPDHVAVALRSKVERAFVPWWGRALALVRRPVPAYGVIAAFVIPLVLWSFAQPPREIAEPSAVPATTPIVIAPATTTSSAAEVPPARVVGYDARSIVPAPVF
jgi:anti-sigma factor RsiW